MEPTADNLRRIDAVVFNALERQNAVGAALGVVRGGRLVLAKGYGYRDLSSRLPVNSETLFEIASNTKQFVAAAILMLQEQGRVSLEEPIERFFPGFPNAHNITVRQLLNHTAGIVGYTEDPNFIRELSLPMSPEWIVQVGATRPPAFAPGTDFQYCNTGYAMAALIVQIVSGIPYQLFILERLCRPLEMKNTIFMDFDEALAPNVAIGYTAFAMGRIRRAPIHDVSWAFGAGDLTSNVQDLAKWWTGLPTLLSPASIAEMTTTAKLDDGHETGYGLGLFVRRLPNGKLQITHGGHVAGFMTQIARYPEDDLELILLGNADQFGYAPILAAIYSIFVPEAKPETPPPLESGKAIERGDADERARTWLDEALAGRLDRSDLREDFDRTMTERALAEVTALGRFGAVTAFEYFTAARRTPTDIFSYNVTFEDRKLRMTFCVDDDNTISGVDFVNNDPIA
jgi:CubicO group peptidase (beta-lactamase class C family)